MTPRPAPRWPPVTETALIVSARNSSATLRRSLSLRRRKSAGDAMLSNSGVVDFVTIVPGRPDLEPDRGKLADLHQDAPPPQFWSGGVAGQNCYTSLAAHAFQRRRRLNAVMPHPAAARAASAAGTPVLRRLIGPSMALSSAPAQT